MAILLFLMKKKSMNPQEKVAPPWKINENAEPAAEKFNKQT